MRIFSTTLWLPKAGSSEEEYEDAAFPLEETHEEWNQFRCAVADGATETSFARQWAELLVSDFAEGTDTDGIDLDQSRRKWLALVGEKELPWYAEEKREKGAYAAFAGLSLAEGGTWSAACIGDCCVVQVRESEVVEAFPLDSSQAFNNRPLLLCSRPAREEPEMSVKTGIWQPEDLFLLMTDALAKFFFSRQEHYNDGVSLIADLEGHEQLRQLADRNRRAPGQSAPADNVELANDDITLLRLIVTD